MSHWQSVLTSSAFGTGSNSIGSITWPAQWHAAVHYHRVRRGKMATDHHQPTCHRAVAARGGAGRALSEATDCIQHRRRGNYRNRAPERRVQSKWNGCVWRRHREKLGRSAQFDATICASKRHNSRLRHGKSTRNGGRSESFLSIGAGVCPAQRSSQAAKAAERWLGGGAAWGGSNCMASWWLHIAPSEASVSRGSHHAALRPARVGGFAA
jgi:hypothetical protein